VLSELLQHPSYFVFTRRTMTEEIGQTDCPVIGLAEQVAQEAADLLGEAFVVEGLIGGSELTEPPIVRPGDMPKYQRLEF